METEVRVVTTHLVEAATCSVGQRATQSARGLFGEDVMLNHDSLVELAKGRHGDRTWSLHHDGTTLRVSSDGPRLVHRLKGPATRRWLKRGDVSLDFWQCTPLDALSKQPLGHVNTIRQIASHKDDEEVRRYSAEPRKALAQSCNHGTLLLI